MEELNTVVTPETVAAPDDGERVSAAVLLGFEEPPAPVEEKVDDAPQETKPETKSEAKPDDSAFATMRRSMERQAEQKLRSDPFRILGQKIVDDIVRAQPDISAEDALRQAEDNLMQAIATRENITPAVAKQLFGQEAQRSTEPADEDYTEQANKIAAELTTMELPEGFDLEAAGKDPTFVQLLTQYPPAAAVRIYNAEQGAKTAKTAAAQDLAEKLQARQQLPQPLTREQPVNPLPNYNAMSDEDVLTERRRRQEARLWG
ncbi:MAG TPA: hypothetical protein VN512_13155 [Clostridia bacterium]|nr:hypothetical protein [Clostridia bacterium]